MSVLSMPDLPDCAVPGCGAPVVLLGDVEGAVEECTGCGTAYWPQPPVGWQQYWRERCRVVLDAAKRGEL